MKNEHFLGNLAALEFECSVSAAELNRKVTESLEENAKDRKKCDVLTSLGSIQSDLVELETTWHYKTDGFTLPIVLVREHKYGTDMDKVRGPKRRFRRKLASTALAQSKPGVLHPPMLALRIGTNSFLPLATFNKNTESESCSYVQIGSEMTTDNLHVVSSDDMQEDRRQLIEEMREFSCVEKYKYNKYSKAPGRVAQLCRQELERNANVVREAVEAQVYRDFDTRAARGMDQDIFTEIRATGHSYDIKKSFGLVGLPVELNDSMQGGLAITMDEDSGARSFGVVARGKAYIPLLSINQNMQSVEPIYTDTLTNGQLLRISKLIRESFSVDGDLLAWGGGQSSLLAHMAATRIITQDRFGQKQVTRATDPLSHMTLLTKKGGTFDTNEVEEYRSYYGDDKKFVNYIKTEAQRAQSVYNHLTKQGSLPIANIGDKTSERLVETIALMSSHKEHSGVLRSVRIGTVLGDLALRATVEQMDGAYTLKVSGRPDALEAGAFSRLYEETVTMVGGTDIDATRAGQLYETLRAMKPIQS